MKLIKNPNLNPENHGTFSIEYMGQILYIGSTFNKLKDIYEDGSVPKELVRFIQSRPGATFGLRVQKEPDNFVAIYYANLLKNDFQKQFGYTPEFNKDKNDEKLTVQIDDIIHQINSTKKSNLNTEKYITKK